MEDREQGQRSVFSVGCFDSNRGTYMLALRRYNYG